MTTMSKMKGDLSCHIPNDKYRNGWENIYGKKSRGVCAGCRCRISKGSMCDACEEQMQAQGATWEGEA